MTIILDNAHRLESLQTIFRKLEEKEERFMPNLARYKGLISNNGDAVTLFTKSDYFLFFVLFMKTHGDV
jgi:hypothetical protein